MIFDRYPEICLTLYFTFIVIIMFSLVFVCGFFASKHDHNMKMERTAIEQGYEQVVEDGYVLWKKIE